MQSTSVVGAGGGGGGGGGGRGRGEGFDFVNRVELRYKNGNHRLLSLGIKAGSASQVCSYIYGPDTLPQIFNFFGRGNIKWS